MQDVNALSKTQLDAWNGLVKDAVHNALEGLSSMTGQKVTAEVVRPIQVDVMEIPEKLGGAGTPAIAVLLGVEHVLGMHLVLVHQPDTAYAAIDMLMGMEKGTTSGLGEMELSTLGEMGNVMCTFFLNTVADTTGYELRPTPPTVRMDMIGALLDYALATIMMEADEITLVEATYGTESSQIEGTFVVLPSPSLQADVLKAWGVE